MCDLCKGSGNLFRVWYGTYEWRTCPICRGRGAHQAFGPATIKGDRESAWRPIHRE